LYPLSSLTNLGIDGLFISDSFQERWCFTPQIKRSTCYLYLAMRCTFIEWNWA